MSSPRLRLNVFQRLMRQWKELAPYNAGTLLHLVGPPDPARWQASIALMVGELGLGRPIFHGDDQASFLPVESFTLDVVEDLEKKTNEELNHGYRDDELPMRFFLCPGENNTHWLGVMFDHWLTDGGTLAELVVRLVVRYAEPLANIGYPPHVFNQADLAELFGSKMPLLTEAGPMREAARVRSEHREVIRFDDVSVSSFVTHFHQEKWPRDLLDKLRIQAKKWGGSGHDLLLAVVAQFLAVGKAEISLASVIDIRADTQVPVQGAFGQFVSFYTNVLIHADQIPLDDLTRQIAEKNRRIKEESRALHNLGALEAARLGWERAATLGEKSRQFHDLAPITAGVSHMKVVRLQREIGRAISRHRGNGQGYRESSPLIDATVVSPTGPLTPLVITVNQLNSESTMMGIIYRTSLYHRPQITAFSAALIRRLAEITSS